MDNVVYIPEEMVDAILDGSWFGKSEIEDEDEEDED